MCLLACFSFCLKRGKDLHSQPWLCCNQQQSTWEWVCMTCIVTGHFIRYILLVLGWALFCLSVLYGIDSLRYWKHSSKIFALCWRLVFVGCTSAMRISHSVTLSCLFIWDLVTVEAVWVQWIHCHVYETDLNFVGRHVFLLGAAIRRWENCCHKVVVIGHQQYYC